MRIQDIAQPKAERTNEKKELQQKTTPERQNWWALLGVKTN